MSDLIIRLTRPRTADQKASRDRFTVHSQRLGKPVLEDATEAKALEHCGEHAKDRELAWRRKEIQQVRKTNATDPKLTLDQARTRQREELQKATRPAGAGEIVPDALEGQILERDA